MREMRGFIFTSMLIRDRAVTKVKSLSLSAKPKASLTIVCLVSPPPLTPTKMKREEHFDCLQSEVYSYVFAYT